jgi:hypothetical protein
MNKYTPAATAAASAVAVAGGGSDVATNAATSSASVVHSSAPRNSGGSGAGSGTTDALKGSESEPSSAVSKEGLTALYKFATGNSHHGISLRETLIEVGVNAVCGSDDAVMRKHLFFKVVRMRCIVLHCIILFVLECFVLYCT